MADHFCLLCYPTGRFPREVNYLWFVMVAKCFPFGCSIKNNIIISLNLVIPSIYLKLLFFGDHSSWQDKNPVIYFPTQEISRKKKNTLIQNCNPIFEVTKKKYETCFSPTKQLLTGQLPNHSGLFTHSSWVMPSNLLMSPITLTNQQEYMAETDLERANKIEKMFCFYYVNYQIMFAFVSGCCI